MNRILLFLALMGAGQVVHAQYVYTIKADSVKITNTCDTAELIIENHTQTVPGFLYNKGRGRTEFRKLLQNVNDNTFLIGGDTLNLSNFWKQGGNSFGATGKFGTLDDNHIDFYTNNGRRARLTTTGKFLINTEEDLGNFHLQVNGLGLFHSTLKVGTDGYAINLNPRAGYVYDGPQIQFGAVYGSVGVNKQDFGYVPENSLLIGLTSPSQWCSMVDFSGNPTLVTSGRGEVIINGGYNGIITGGSVGLGIDATAHTFKIYGARGTGTGTLGDIVFYTGNAQPSGATIHSMTSRWFIKGGTGYMSNLPNPSVDIPTSSLDVYGDSGYSQLRLRKSYTPTSHTDTNGKVGDVAWDGEYIYIKTTQGWGRSTLDYNF